MMGRPGTAMITLGVAAVALAGAAAAGAQGTPAGLELDGPTASVRTPQFSAGEGVFVFAVTGSGPVRLRADTASRARGCAAAPPARTQLDRLLPRTPFTLRLGVAFRGARGPQTLCAWLVPASGAPVVLAAAQRDVALLEDPVEASVAPAAGARAELGRPLRLVGTVRSDLGVPEGFCRFGQRVGGRWVDTVRFPFRGGECTGVLRPRTAGVQRLRMLFTSFDAGDWAPATALTRPVLVAGSGRITAGRPSVVRARRVTVTPGPHVRGRAVRVEARLTSPAGPPAGVCRFQHRVGGEWIAGPDKPFRGGLCRGAVVPAALGLQRFRVVFVPADPGAGARRWPAARPCACWSGHPGRWCRWPDRPGRPGVHRHSSGQVGVSTATPCSRAASARRRS